MTPRKIQLTLIWLLTALMVFGFSYGTRSSTILGGNILPAGNDSFYHAARMIDTAENGGIIQFDTNMHAPEGSWVTWPWTYDYLAGKALGVALHFNPDMEPMAFLGMIPVVFTVVNVTLLLLLAWQIGLRIELIAAAGLSIGLSPTMQLLHGFATIDHHFIELIFVLGALSALMHWLAHPESRRAAVLLGVALGLAPGFHTGSFILQLPVLITIFVLWLRGQNPNKETTLAMCIALLVSSLVVLLPSEPFRNGFFELSTLSVFHGFVALSTAVAMMIMATRTFSAKSFAILAGASALLAAPMLGEILLGSSFIAGDIILFDQIIEARSPFVMLQEQEGIKGVSSLYSWAFFVLIPLLIYFAYRCFRQQSPAMLAFSISSVFGIALMLMQYRLVYFGYAAMMLGPMLAIMELDRFKVPRAGVGLLGLLYVAIVVQPQLRGQLFARQIPALSRQYELVYPVFDEIEKICAADPGLMITTNNDGHHVRYHSKCPVFANNFLLTPQHEEKIGQLIYMLSSDAQTFRRLIPAETKYVFLRLDQVFIYYRGDIGIPTVEKLKELNPKSFMELALAEEPVEGFELLWEIRTDDDRNVPLAQIYRVTPIDDPNVKLPRITRSIEQDENESD